MNIVKRARSLLRPERVELPSGKDISRVEANAVPERTEAGATDYAVRLDRERAFYGQCLNVHDLPKIALYWHHQHLMKKFRHFGISHPGEIFEIELIKRCREHPTIHQVLSIGSGNCDLEIHLARVVRNSGLSNFKIQCLDLSPDMLSRGAAQASENGVADHVEMTVGDFNLWTPDRDYDVVIANQSLHHVLNLEHLLDSIRDSLKEDGCFLTSDMIGRNGHMRWPEALAIVHEFWRQLPGGYRWNRQLQRYEDLYENWNCAEVGFEGVRSQDILPLLVERFQFEMFLAFGNVIDPFVDRGFGHNFWPETDWDRNFIDRVHERDDAELQAGKISPTHMVAIMKKSSATTRIRHLAPMTPAFAIRQSQ